jgi:hypothetical protein
VGALPSLAGLILDQRAAAAQIAMATPPRYVLDEAEAERRKAKPCERVINQSLERAARGWRKSCPTNIRSCQL